MNGYFPNGGTRADWTEMLSYKLEFYDHLIDYSRKIKESWKHMILTWDFNICHREIDIARPEANKNSIWFLPVERKKIWELFESWFVDVWRYLNPTKTDIYSWWSYRAGARDRNVWWRIDYFAVSKNILKQVKNMKYLTDVMWSDHCPLVLEI
jgi:exodeoxyribonuclease-3